VRLTNLGTGPAHYEWVLNETTRVFSVNKKEGIVSIFPLININHVDRPQ
jgi:hypothetical protein